MVNFDDSFFKKANLTHLIVDIEAFNNHVNHAMENVQSSQKYF